MNSIKDTLNNLELTNDTLYDFIYDLFLYTKLEECKKEIENGKVLTLEESIERMKNKYADFHIQ